MTVEEKIEQFRLKARDCRERANYADDRTSMRRDLEFAEEYDRRAEKLSHRIPSTAQMMPPENFELKPLVENEKYDMTENIMHYNEWQLMIWRDDTGVFVSVEDVNGVAGLSYSKYRDLVTKIEAQYKHRVHTSRGKTQVVEVEQLKALLRSLPNPRKVAAIKLADWLDENVTDSAAKKEISAPSYGAGDDFVRNMFTSIGGAETEDQLDEFEDAIRSAPPEMKRVIGTYIEQRRSAMQMTP